MYIYSHFSCFRDCIDYCNDIKFLFLIMIMILLLLLLFFRKKKKIKSKGVGGVGYPLNSHRGGERTSLGGTYTPYTFFTSSYTAYTPYMLYQG